MSMGNISLDNTLGAFFIGATLANILFGITCLQSALYYKSYPNDGWLYKASLERRDTDAAADGEQVGIIWILDTFDVAVTTHTLYFYAIKNFGDIQVFTQRNIVWSFKVLVRIFVQAMYALRVWKRTLSFLYYLAPPYSVRFSSLQATPLVGYLIKDVYLVSSFSDTPSIKSALISMFVSSVAAEFVVAVAMCYCLDKTTTITALITMMRMILMTGFVTSFYSIVILVTFLLWPDTLIFLGFDCLAPKLFINSLLALLNARGNFRNTKNSFRLPTIDSTGLTSESMRGHPAKDKNKLGGRMPRTPFLLLPYIKVTAFPFSALLERNSH
ncbi:hypothetical protein ARMGADRAFT_1028626 [Armillaria gallica]|uniref:DUF6534 domain-containing protein n=1 Tax=Armillaria gallica TaxID=47427 RepID=A0A2H3E1N6_ARMGA|nr:hypothetical protein ARMGADRAFT_1028626 [Armillaria gallica]